MYKFKKIQFILLIISSLLLILFVLSVFFGDTIYNILDVEEFDNENDFDYDHQIEDNDSSSISFYEKMLVEYKDEVKSTEDLQKKVMDGIVGKNNRKNVDKAELIHDDKLEVSFHKPSKVSENIRIEDEITKKIIKPEKVEKIIKLDKAEILEKFENTQKDVKNIKVEDDNQRIIKNSIEKSNSNNYKFENSNLMLIKKLFSKIVPIINESSPKFGYQLQNEKDIGNKRRRFRLSKKYLSRTYGDSNIVNVAVHDTDDRFPILSRNYLNDCLYLPPDMFESLKISHKNFVDNIPEIYDQGTYTGEGIVLIGGGKFSWLSLLSIENLRSVGSKLPIEIMIPQPDDYEPQLCETILPKLNAKCLLLYEVFPDIINNNDKSKKSTGGFKLTGYQYKSLSLLASTFEKVIFLDSDNIAVLNPDHLFKAEPFLSNGMILWPDFWRRVTHPMYYDLAGFKISNKRVRNLIDKVSPPELYTNFDDDPDNDIPLHDREGAIPDLSTESGQIIINKKTHFKSLLLSFYYNVYGPRHFYPLFSQGGKGEGDKETFIAAAQYYQLPVYQVNKPVGVIGHWHKNGYQGVGMVQYDPISDKDYEDKYKQDLMNRISNEGEHFNYNRLEFFNYFNDKNSNPMFIHCNYPKLDPVGLIKEKKLLDDEGHEWRLYSDQPNIGFDFEVKQWKLINKYFCSDEQELRLKYLLDSNVSMEELCEAIDARLDFLYSSDIRLNWD